MIKYDLIIVGAGPAGLMLARQLDDTNLDILLVDQKKKLGSTNTGIYGCVRHVIDRLGLTEYIVNKPTGMYLYGSKQITGFKYKSCPYVNVDINKWAKELRLKCNKKLSTKILGIEKKDNGYIVMDDKKNKYYGEIVVDCTGNNQVLSSILGIRRSAQDFYSASFELENCSIPKERASEVAIAYDRTYTNYGIWFYNYGRKKCQFGMGDMVGAKDIPTKEIIKRAKQAMSREPWSIWLKDAKIEKESVGFGPTIGAHKPIVLDNFVSIGNAAGTGLPFIGVGLRFALEMSDYASQIIHRSIILDDCSTKQLSAIKKEFNRRYSRNFFYMQIFQQLGLKYMEQKDWDLFLDKFSKDFNSGEGYRLAYGDLDLPLLLKMFSFRSGMRMFFNIINFHLPKFLRFKERKCIPPFDSRR